MLPTKFHFIWLGSFKGEDFLDIDQSETRIAYSSKMKTNFKKSGVTCLYYTLHVGIHILIFFSAHLAKDNVGFWHHLACLLTDRDEMRIFHRGHSIDASYQVSVHLAKRFQRRRF
jgi:hypothetical protein